MVIGEGVLVVVSVMVIGEGALSQSGISDGDR